MGPDAQLTHVLVLSIAKENSELSSSSSKPEHGAALQNSFLKLLEFKQEINWSLGNTSRSDSQVQKLCHSSRCVMIKCKGNYPELKSFKSPMDSCLFD
ncbi:hypothetical protein AV530_007678 [Patagioenas fasciata monilis]|uniref:Uncharacterized protein n=1 Tax=Patagioenas fasciata monilis TaxID=372326 RepID=A0A1V4JZ06_PATFA|nr:hypothetical protein AV530_007678 [Patagioenas fasciata monilis]